MHARPILLIIASSVLAGCPLTPEPAPGGEAIIEDLPYEGRAFPNQRTPIAIPSGGMALVAAGEADSVSAFDAATADALATLPVGRDPIGVDGPVDIAVDAVNKVVYLPLAYPELYEGIHGAHEGHAARLGWLQQLALEDLRVLAEVEVDSAPSAVAISDDGKRIAVTHFPEDSLQEALDTPEDLEFARGRLAVLETEGFGVATEPDKVRVCVGENAVALSRPDGARAFVSCYGEDALAIVDLAAADRSVDRVAVGDAPGPAGAPAYGPAAAVPSGEGSRVAVPCEISRDVRLLDASSGELAVPASPRVGVPGVPAWSAGDGRLWVPEREPDAIAALDGSTLEELTRRELASAECVAPREVVTAGDDRLLLSCEGDETTDATLLVLDAQTLQTVASAVLTKPARGLSWVGTGTRGGR